jgi:hypothetical protein
MRYFAAILMMVLVAGASLPAEAQPPFPRRGMEGGGVSLDMIVASIRARFPGQLSDVQAFGPRYRIRWLTPDGRILLIDADARTGQIIGVQGEPGGGPRNFAPQDVGPGDFDRRGRGRFRGDD